MSNTTTRTRNASGQFVAVKKAKTTPVKRTVKRVDPAKAQRAEQKAKALAARAANLTLAEARANAQKAERAIKQAEKAGTGVVTARIKANTARQILALVEARPTTPVTPAKRRRTAPVPARTVTRRESLYV